MKKLLYILLFVPVALFGQITEGIKFHGVATDENGFGINDQTLQLQLRILKDSMNTSHEYIETHKISTSHKGEYSLVIGSGISEMDITEVQWKAVKYLKLKIDYDLDDIYDITEVVSFNVIPSIDLDYPYPYSLFKDYLEVPKRSPFSKNKLTRSYFRQIGWSKDNIFIYLKTKCDDMAGCGGSNRIVVMNSITNEVIESIRFYRRDEGEIIEQRSTSNGVFNFNVVLDSLINKYNIIENSNTQFIPSKTLVESGINIFLEKEQVLDTINCPLNLGQNNYRLSHNLILGNDKIGYKSISNGLSSCFIADLNIEGYLFNPFENRILIVLSYKRNPPLSTYGIYFMGCNLDESTFN